MFLDHLITLAITAFAKTNYEGLMRNYEGLMCNYEGLMH